VDASTGGVVDEEPEELMRLLRIVPAENPDRDVKCDLSTVSLDDNPQYQALSYIRRALGASSVTNPSSA
jgi:hypothetical protein